MVKKWTAILGCCALAGWSTAQVSVMFQNTTLPQGTTNDIGVLTLVFDVDGSGNVTLDASTTRSEQNVVDAVNAWDGAVGTVSHSGAFNTQFSLVLNDVGGSGLKLTNNDGGGLGVGGQNAWRIDRPGIESITADAIIASGKLKLNSILWNHRANSTVDLLLTEPGGSITNSLGSGIGTWNVAGYDILLQSGQQLELGNVDLGALNDGYALAGLTFDLTDGAITPEVADLVPDVYPEGSYYTEVFDGKTVWVADNTNDRLFFDVPDSFNFVPGQPVYVRIEYHDSGFGNIFAEYDSNLGDSTADRYQDSETHARSSRMNGHDFVYNYQQFKSPLFNNRQNGQNDFRIKINNGDGTPFRVASVQISTQPYQDEKFLYALTEPWLTPYSGEVHDFVDNTTLAGKVMTGYQGWFGAPNDVMDDGWNHWGGGSGRGSLPSEKWMTIDAWPYMDEYELNDLYRAGDMYYEDGRPAYLFSSRDPKTVQRHFKWMRRHGIDGAYLQFFVNQGRTGANGYKHFVLNNVMEAAAKEGRIWALEYDVSGLSTDLNTALNVMTNDWNWMVNEAKITEDPRYAHEDGKPVLFIWGFPVESREFPVETANAVLDWFGQQDLYLICGTRWRTEPEWQAHFQKYDQLLVWMERDLEDSNPSNVDLTHYKTMLDSWGMKILPHAWAGFSWHNLKMYDFPTSYTPRDAGQFYWDRLYNAVAVGADQIFLGMFDEYDEATHLMPMADYHPNIYSEGTNSWGHYIDNEGKDPFWYLQLSDAAREMLNGQRPLSSTMPVESSIKPAAFSGEDATCYLATNDTAIGLVHVQQADGLTAGSFVSGQNCRTNAGSYYYFAIDDTFAGHAVEGMSATIELEYFDDAPGRNIRLQYDSTGAAYQNHSDLEVTTGSNRWKPMRWNVDDAFFGNRQNGMSDFRINIVGGEAVAIRRMSVVLPEELGGAVPGDVMAVVDGGLEWPEKYDVVGWRLSETDNLASNDWKEVADVTYTNGMFRHEVETTNSAGFFRLGRPARQ